MEKENKWKSRIKCFYFFFLCIFNEVCSVQIAKENFTGKLFLGSPLGNLTLESYKSKQLKEKLFWVFAGSGVVLAGRLKNKSKKNWGFPIFVSCCFFTLAGILRRQNQNNDFFIKNSLLIMKYCYTKIKNHDEQQNEQQKLLYSDIVPFLIDNNNIKKILLHYVSKNNLENNLDNNADEEEYKKACTFCSVKIEEIKKMIQDRQDIEAQLIKKSRKNKKEKE